MVHWQRWRVRLRTAVLTGRKWPVWLALCLLLTGCATSSPRPDVVAIPPLDTPAGPVTAKAARAEVTLPPLLELSPEMIAFVDRYTGEINSRRARLTALHSAVTGPSVLALEYRTDADGTAAQAFDKAAANCLSFAHLFVALARQSGLKASYQLMEVRPQWTRLGERVALRLHINVVVDLPRGERYMVDIDPLERWEISGSDQLSDTEAAALHLNNLGMAALGGNQLQLAYAHLAQAVDLAPERSELWANLGAIYRQNNQLEAAETSYLRSLDLDPGSRTAMNNLVVLYGLMGRQDEREDWMRRVARHRERNPYYHAHLGDTAAEVDDWEAAESHYREAVRLGPQDAFLHYQLAVILLRRQDVTGGVRSLERAVEHATLRADRDNYQARLKALRQQLQESLPG